jgi:hypothetical protein
MTNKLAKTSSSIVIASLIVSNFVPTAHAGYGTSSTSNTAASVVCNNESPAKPVFEFVRKSGASEIEIGWNKVERANKWTVAYGIEKGKYIYGAADFGDENSRSTKIAMLPAGTYYIVVKASNGCKPGEFSDERKMTVFNDGRVLGAKTFRSYVPRVLGDKVEATPAPSVEPSSSPETFVLPQASSAPVEGKPLNWFQRLIKFIFG